MTGRIKAGTLSVVEELHHFVVQEALPGTGISADQFCNGYSAIVRELAPRNRALLDVRDSLQARIDGYHTTHKGQPLDLADYTKFLRDIGYLLPEPAACTVTTANIDAEIAQIAGPQLVVPMSNARYSLNAVNARWGSLYDAFYGTDAIPETGELAKGNTYNAKRGEAVVAKAKSFLDATWPLAQGKHADAASYVIEGGKLVVGMPGGKKTELVKADDLAGYLGDAAAPSLVLLQNHGLHAEIKINRTHPMGKIDPAGVSDIVVESALTSIMDMEDSVAAVDAAD